MHQKYDLERITASYSRHIVMCISNKSRNQERKAGFLHPARRNQPSKHVPTVEEPLDASRCAMALDPKMQKIWEYVKNGWPVF